DLRGGTEPRTHSYLVRSGDTLSEIAERELGSAKRWQEIVAANPGLDPNRLPAGESIQLPGAAAARPQASSKDAVTPAAGASTGSRKGAGTWKAGRGENLWKIAGRALGSGARGREIAALTPKVDPEKLVQGQVLALPAKSPPQPKPQGASPAKT